VSPLLDNKFHRQLTNVIFERPDLGVTDALGLRPHSIVRGLFT
jgi:hypothetical protein